MARESGEQGWQGWQRLAHLIAAERGRRRWTAEDLAERAQLSERTIDYLEAGVRRRYRDSTLGRVEDAFGWPPGTAIGIVSGAAQPAPADELLERVTSCWPLLSPQQQEAVVALLDTMTRQR